MTWEQTAEVLAKEVDRLQKENDTLRVFVHEVAYVNASDFADGWKALAEFAKRGRCLLSPTDEGGGAAIGGESEALQAAIMGLHTLAGEFPNPMWKTREDYLNATISEINEILGKQ